MTQQCFVYCKENQRSMTEKDSLFGMLTFFKHGLGRFVWLRGLFSAEPGTKMFISGLSMV